MIANQNFRIIKETAKTDNQGRLTLGNEGKEKNYRVMMNDAGQILLDPVLEIPETELWLWRNPEALAALQRGIQQAVVGEGRFLGYFCQYADLEIED